MKILPKEKYSKAIAPLLKVKFNNLFARAVIEKHVSGVVYVDNIDKPTSFYILHPYGISLLFGNCNNPDFNTDFKAYALNISKNRKDYEWMQAYSNNWHPILNQLFSNSLVKVSEKNNDKSGIVELHTRVNFKFNSVKYLAYKQNSLAHDFNIVPVDKQIFNAMKGSVIPLKFWDSSEDFEKMGAGFSLMHNNQLTSTAYSAFVVGRQLEIGIETLPEFRGKGYALHTCSSLIDYCLANNYEPVWSCRLENTGSYKLAQKLGFEPTVQHPFYRLSN